eukprot:TRINITY_DN1610_c0_g1_i6.p2 TRINITY_DN1610_c0_g1~~TRINITY_DN1610_c0_g1_i6.p2  ORF type:complete len:167 (+),score=33.86 TRINITY_DN1610_c0_g1_i6:76-576(+)
MAACGRGGSELSQPMLLAASNGVPVAPESWIQLLDEDNMLNNMSVTELRGHLALLAAPESDSELAWAVLTSGPAVNALFGRNTPGGPERARIAKSYLQGLQEQHHLAGIVYYRDAIMEATEYHEALAQTTFCTRCCGARRELRASALHGLRSARAELECRLSGVML